ncbi:MAG: thioredoxin family protein [Armatimonadota bacterium]
MKTLLVGLAVAVLANCPSASDTALKTVEEAYPYMCSGALRLAEITDLGPDTIATAENFRITSKDLDEQINKAPAYIRDEMRNYPVYVLEDCVTDRLITLEAKEWAASSGRDPDSDSQLVRDYLDTQRPKPTVTEEEAAEFYKEHSKLYGDLPFERIRDAVIGYLADERQTQAQNQFKADASKRHKVRVSASWLALEYKKWAANPIEKARTSGKPTFVNFSVIGCCDKTFPVVEDFRRSHADKVNVVFVHVGQEEVLAGMYGIRTIPVQIFFDKDGKEHFRHTGFLSKEQILAKLSEMGVH